MNTPVKISIQLVSRCDLKTEQIEQLWTIYQKSYTIRKEEFLEKMKSIDLYACYVHKAEIVGFTGIRYRTLMANKKKHKGLYLGQTIVPKEFRGKSLIRRTVVKLLGRHYLKAPFTPLVIWSNAITYRPYLVMAKGLKYYYPNPDRPLTADQLALRDSIGREYYQNDYDPKTGTVQKDATPLEEHEISYSEKELADKHVSYFFEQNPRSSDGHGLICYANGNLRNLMYYLNHKRLKK